MENRNKNLSVWVQSLTNAYNKFEAINPEKAKTELGFAKQLFQNNLELQKCEPQSILDAIVNVARTSVTLNPVMRLAYLIPRKRDGVFKCNLEFSYMGLVAMLRDYGCIKSISAHIVYADEEFEYEISENKIKHRPKFAKSEKEHNNREIIGCYSRATLLNNDIVYEFMPMWEIMKIKSKSVGSNSEKSAWNTWRDEMIKKSVIKRHFKLLISLNPHEVLTEALTIETENNPLIDDFNSDKQTYSISTAFDFVEEIEEQETEKTIIKKEIIPAKEEAPVKEKIETIKQEESSENQDNFQWDLPIEEKEVIWTTDEVLDDDIRFDFPDGEEEDDDNDVQSSIF
jgi:phage RecT family recombinase